jgi:parallel beta-helix repeat protein
MGETTNVKDCMNLTKVNTVYTLINNLVGNQSHTVTAGGNPCIDIQADNITLNCAGYNITETNAGTTLGILIDGTNNTLVKNCAVYNYTNGNIIAYYGSNSTVFNNTVGNSNGDGIDIFYAPNNNITNNTAYNNNGAYGIKLTSAGNTSIIRNIAFNNSKGIIIQDCNNTTLTSNNASLNSNMGIGVETASSNNTLTNNIASGNSVWDFYSASSSSNNTVINLTTNDTNSSFTYSGDFSLKSVIGTNIPDPSGYSNISHYLDITNSSAAWIYINISYKSSDIPTNVEIGRAHV